MVHTFIHLQFTRYMNSFTLLCNLLCILHTYIFYDDGSVAAWPGFKAKMLLKRPKRGSIYTYCTHQGGDMYVHTAGLLRDYFLPNQDF